MGYRQNSAVLKWVALAFGACLFLFLTGTTLAEVSSAFAQTSTNKASQEGILPIGPFRFEYVCFVIFIFSFPAAVLLTIVTKWVAKFQLLFWTAFMIQIITSVVHYFVGTISGNALVEQGFKFQFLVNIVLYLLVSSLIYGLLIQHPETGRIGLPKGMLVTLYLLFTVFALSLFFVIIVTIFSYLFKFLQ